MGDDYFGFLGWFCNTQRLTLTDLDAAAEAVGLTPAKTLPEHRGPDTFATLVTCDDRVSPKAAD